MNKQTIYSTTGCILLTLVQTDCALPPCDPNATNQGKCVQAVSDDGGASSGQAETTTSQSPTSDGSTTSNSSNNTSQGTTIDTIHDFSTSTTTFASSTSMTEETTRTTTESAMTTGTVGTTGSSNCGNGMIEVGEECDNGSNNNNNDACTTECVAAICGDGHQRTVGTPDEIEECDDGNDINTDDCTTECNNAFCGDGFIHDDEECDKNLTPASDFCNGNCERVGKYVFVTKPPGFNGDLNGPDGADAFCQQRAEEAQLITPDESVFKAWISAGGESPNDRFSGTAQSYFLTDGITRVAQSYSDLVDGSALENGIHLTEDPEYGIETEIEFAWSNTDKHGNPYNLLNDCDNYSSIQLFDLIYNGSVGLIGEKDITWTRADYLRACNNEFALYCFEQ